MPHFKMFSTAQLVLNVAIAAFGFVYGHSSNTLAALGLAAVIALAAVTILHANRFGQAALPHPDCDDARKSTFVVDVSFIAVCQAVLGLAVVHDLWSDSQAPYSFGFALSLCVISGLLLKSMDLVAQDFEQVAVVAWP